MRIEKYEKIFLSRDEAETWKEFEQILDDLKQEIENPDIKELICEIRSMLWDLREEVEDIE